MWIVADPGQRAGEVAVLRGAPYRSARPRAGTSGIAAPNGRAGGVRGRIHTGPVEAHATREVILATGSIATPKILQNLNGPVTALAWRAADVILDNAYEIPRAHGSRHGQGRPADDTRSRLGLDRANLC